MVLQSTVVGVRLVEHARSPYPRRPQNLSPTFGIESSYRMMEKRAPAPLPTTLPCASCSWAGLILLNIWIALQWTYLRIQGSAPAGR